MTTRKNSERQDNILNTWGKNLNILFYSDHEDKEKKIIKVSDRTDYHSNEEKHINVLNYILANKLSFEWFFFCDDDTFVNPQNLSLFMDNADKNKIYGSVISYKKSPDNPIFNVINKEICYFSGGAGYLVHKDILFSFEKYINYHVGYSDVSFGLNINNKCKLEHCEKFNFHNPNYHQHDNLKRKEMITYHYVKTLPEIMEIL